MERLTLLNNKGVFTEVLCCADCRPIFKIVFESYQVKKGKCGVCERRDFYRTLQVLLAHFVKVKGVREMKVGDKVTVKQSLNVHKRYVGKVGTVAGFAEGSVWVSLDGGYRILFFKDDLELVEESGGGKEVS